MMRLDLKQNIIKADSQRIGKGVPVINSIRNLARELIKAHPHKYDDLNEVAEWLRRSYTIGFESKQMVSGLSVDELIKDVCEILRCEPHQLIINNNINLKN